MVTLEGNEAVASVAHRLSEVIAIYPITPSSPLGEFTDDWSSKNKKNLWGTVPEVVEMQSEGGAAGAVHGSLQAGALTTTFSASQGLLLIIPNMYKIAGELHSFVMHVTARTLATHALSIFGDHGDVMSCRQTGFAMLCSNSGQEAQDFAAIAHAATLKARVPFLHFFDGFRTSHEVTKIEQLLDDDLRALIDPEKLADFRRRALTPDHPQIRGTAQNPDTFFQAREACNPWYLACPGTVQATMDKFAGITGRQYHLFDYVGAPDAERVVVMMGSGAEAVEEMVDWLNARGEKVGLVKVRLYRPFDVAAFVAALPASVKSIAVLDRVKEPGAVADPLYLDIVAALQDALAEGQIAAMPRVVAGRYGLASKEFGPDCVQAIYAELAKDKPRRRFTVGINDDVTHLSLPVDTSFDIEPEDVVRAVFFGLGSDGTVGANRNSIKIIGEETPNYAQAYFVFDSKKSGAMTISHLRFGPRKILSTYLIKRANFVACHQPTFMDKYDVLDYAEEGATFLLNSSFSADQVWDTLPREAQEQIIAKRLKFYTIDAVTVAKETGMGGRINTIMQTCFFAISGVLPRDEAIAKIKQSIQKTYQKKGDEVVKRNWAAVDQTLDNLFEVAVPAQVTATFSQPPIVPDEAPDFVKGVTGPMAAFKGDLLPVSAFAADGTWPTATTQWERRNIALDIPIWDEKICIQCNKCSLVCPHAAIRAKIYNPALLADAPETFRATDFKAKDWPGHKLTIQVAPEDCTGCGLCVSACPAKDKANPKHKALNMETQLPIRAREVANYAFFLDLPDLDRTKIERIDVKFSQFYRPLFEYSGACAGCGETPYVKLMTQLFGDRLLMANATGCSSIYGGNLPTTPYCQDLNGRGPAWSNSLFEDNAEYGFGQRLACDSHRKQACELLVKLAPQLGETLVDELIHADQHGEANIAAQRARVAALKAKLAGMDDPQARFLLEIADYLVRKSVWIMGGDGWAYDIGYGGLDHVLAMQRDVNILVLDTEVYSNTGGQASKSTPIGAAAKYAALGKSVGKKDLGLMAMSYRHVYVASVAMGARDAQTVQAFLEAESYPGPSLIIAYSHCIAHGYDLVHGLDQQKLAVGSGIWPLYRFDPRRIEQGLPPLQLDAPAPKDSVQDYMRNETRFRMVEKIDPKRFAHLAVAAADFSAQRVAFYQQMANIVVPAKAGEANGADSNAE
jgi:pyruvate-ferredoxin/flavodoxin oxidoreductase